MVNLQALTQASYESDFLEMQPPVFDLLWRHFELNINADTVAQTIRIECDGNHDALALVEGIESRLIVPADWRVEIC